MFKRFKKNKDENPATDGQDANTGTNDNVKSGPIVIELDDADKGTNPGDAPQPPEDETFQDRMEDRIENVQKNFADAKEKISFKFAVAKILTSPIWKPPVMAGKMAFNGMKNKKTIGGKLGTTAVAGAALATYFTALTYAGAYGTAAVGERYWFGQPYSSGERTGVITKLSLKGKFPCNTLEGELSMPNIGRDGSSTFEFSMRRLEFEAIANAQAAYENGSTVSLHYDQSHLPDEWFDPEHEGWFLPSVGVMDVECIQKTSYNVHDVVVRDGVELPDTPRLRAPGE